jgi:hypothetical protein
MTNKHQKIYLSDKAIQESTNLKDLKSELQEHNQALKTILGRMNQLEKIDKDRKHGLIKY